MKNKGGKQWFYPLSVQHLDSLGNLHIGVGLPSLDNSVNLEKREPPLDFPRLTPTNLSGFEMLGDPPKGDLLKLLDVSSEESVLLTTYGKLQPPLGKHRLKIVEFISVLPTIGSEAAEKELIRLGAIQQILDLFFKYPYNNFMHHHVENIIVSCLESKNRPLIEHLLRECNLVGKILEAEKNYTLSADLNKPTVPAEGRTPPRIGNIGHLTRISNKLVQLGSSNTEIEAYLKMKSSLMSAGVSLPQGWRPRCCPSGCHLLMMLSWGKWQDIQVHPFVLFPFWGLGLLLLLLQWGLELEHPTPLSMILADRRSMVFSTNKGKEVVIGEAGPGTDKESDRVSFNGLLAVSRFLGLPAEGFEEEILVLLEKIRERKGREGQALRRASKSGSSRFERELKKLEWDGVQSRNRQILRLGSAEGEGDSRCGVLVLWDNRVLELLDQFLVSEGWEGHFSRVVQCILPRPMSDHSPILLDGDGVEWRPNIKSMRFEALDSLDATKLNAFMEEGRQFLDVVLIDNEAIDLMLKRNTGLRQGDLLSSYMFVLAMETLNCLLERAREGGFLLDLKVNGRVGVGLEVPMSCSLMTWWCFLSWLLMWFKAILGLKINLTKSELILVKRVENLEELAVVIVRLRLEQIERDFLWGGGTLKRKISFLVGNGKRVKFWKDKWYGDKPLSVSFPSLLALATSKEAWMADLWSRSNGRGMWTPRFSRHLNDWEIDYNREIGIWPFIVFFVTITKSQLTTSFCIVARRGSTNPEKMRFFGVSSGLPNKIGLELAQGDPKLQHISLGLAGERKTLSTDNMSLRDL
ncbi:hypothetical protein AAG906_028278 [Vitis piasezkii]